ncbi:hypothetical protein [Marinicella sp. W31]|uniref:hypothetical protein n=1 Tax=Marinicella sp. W31 TaxID=3023713 RepID=UPI0037565863
MNNRVSLLLLSSLLVLAACSSQEQTLEEKAVARWEHLIKGEFNLAYEYLTPGYRQTENVESYGLRMGASQVEWQEVTYEKKECEDENLCVVHVNIQYLYVMPVAGGKEMVQTTTIRENWIKKDDGWYYLPKKS